MRLRVKFKTLFMSDEEGAKNRITALKKISYIRYDSLIYLLD